MKGEILQTDRVLLGSADPQIDYWCTYSAFLNDLYMAILFFGEVTIPDIYFFASEHLSKYLLDGDEQPGDTLLEHAINQGLVVLAMKENFQTFQEACQHNKKIGIYGLHERSEDVARRLDQIGEVSSFKSEVWTGNFGLNYRSLAEQVVLIDRPPRQCRIDPSIWEASKPLRFDSFNAAIARAHGTDTGLRRSLWQTEIAKHYPEVFQAERLDRMSRFIEEVNRHPSINLQEKMALEHVFEWVNQTYVAHLGKMLKAFPVISYSRLRRNIVPWRLTDLWSITGAEQLLYFEDHGWIVSERVRVEDFNEAIPQIALSGEDCIAATITTFGTDVLRKIPASTLLSIRNEEGQYYFSTLRKWRNREPKTTAGDVLEAQSSYCKALNDRVRGKYPATRWVSLLTRLDAAGQYLGTAGAVQTAAALWLSGSVGKLPIDLIFVGGMICLASKGLSAILKPRHRRIRLPYPIVRRFELAIQGPSERNDSEADEER